MSDSLVRQGGRGEKGRSLVSLCAGALALNLLMVFGLLGLITWKGMGLFWQRDLHALQVTTEESDNPRVVFGQIMDRERIEPEPGAGPATTDQFRVQLYRGNKKQNETGYFEWIREDSIVSKSTPGNLAYVERLEGGPLIGVLREIRRRGEAGEEEVLAANEADSWAKIDALADVERAERDAAEEISDGELKQLSHQLQQLGWRKRSVELAAGEGGTPDAARLAEIESERASIAARADTLEQAYLDKRLESRSDYAIFATAEGELVEVVLSDLVHVLRPNEMGFFAKLGFYFQRAWEFLSENPRESNTEGGVFPQIFGTVMMVLLMSILVVPVGVLAALYLREYAKQGFVVRAVRIAVNNLAGTPSIVFGVFGWGFFILFVGGEVDALLYPERLPEPTFGTGGILWASLTLALLTLPVVIVASEEGLAAVPADARAGSLALGATKWETLRKVVIPASSPAILTGAILAMARAAGEVAPLMVVGLQKSADALPFDGTAPYVHLERKFMHLGFHIYDLGYQSPDVDLVRPQIFTTALLLVGLVTVINLVAIIIRNRLREKYSSSHV